MSSAEDDRTKESATVLNKVATAAFPANGLAPWMSHYDKKMEAVIVGIKTIADVAEELERQVFLAGHPNGAPKPEGEEELFDLSKQQGAAYIMGFGLNRLASNMHNFAPSIDGMRTRQAIALAKANNPGVMSQPGQGDQKRSIWDKLTGKGKEKDKQ
jgi:hypothetical protein